MRGGTCGGCGCEAATLAPWRRHDRERTTELYLCADCRAAAEAEEAEELRRSRRTTLILAAVAAVVGAVSLAGPPIWPVVMGWLWGVSPRLAAQEREAAAPMSPYKPADLTPLNQNGP